MPAPTLSVLICSPSLQFLSCHKAPFYFLRTLHVLEESPFIFVVGQANQCHAGKLGCRLVACFCKSLNSRLLSSSPMTPKKESSLTYGQGRSPEPDSGMLFQGQWQGLELLLSGYARRCLGWVVRRAILASAIVRSLGKIKRQWKLENAREKKGGSSECEAKRGNSLGAWELIRARGFPPAYGYSHTFCDIVSALTHARTQANWRQASGLLRSVVMNWFFARI